MKTVLSFVRQCKGKMIMAVLLETLSVSGGFVPYVAVYRILVLFFDDLAVVELVWPLVVLCAAGYLGKVLLHAVATTLSHESAYSILENIRLGMTKKLMKAPLGTVLSRTGGGLKNISVDRVETIELPLAHLIPEGLSNLLVPLVAFGYMLYINWQLALWSLLCVPLAFMVYNIVLVSDNKKYAEFMQASDHVNSVIVVYVEGIEVIKALPNGYNTTAGEAGGRLSGGERQRIAIASLVSGKTVVVIAHRFKTMQNAEQTLVVENGTSAASGNHHQLIGSEGTYKKFWEIRQKAESWKI